MYTTTRTKKPYIFVTYREAYNRRTRDNPRIQDYQRRKATLLGIYNTHIKDIAHETWIGNFIAQDKRRLQRSQELYATEQHKIDKTVYSTDELQSYAIYKPALDTYKKQQKIKQLLNTIKILKH